MDAMAAIIPGLFAGMTLPLDLLPSILLASWFILALLRGEIFLDAPLRFLSLVLA